MSVRDTLNFTGLDLGAVEGVLERKSNQRSIHGIAEELLDKIRDELQNGKFTYKRYAVATYALHFTIKNVNLMMIEVIDYINDSFQRDPEMQWHSLQLGQRLSVNEWELNFNIGP